MNIKETVESGRPLTYIALRSDNHKALLLNNQEKFIVVPGRTETSNTEVEITTPEGTKTLNYELFRSLGFKSRAG